MSVRYFIHIPRITMQLIMLLTAFAQPAHGAESWSIGDIRIEQAWARIASPSANLGSIYLTVHNNSEDLDYLIAATSPAAGSAAIYELKSEKGAAKLVPIPGGLNLAGHREIIMRPDGIQLILSQMKTPPAPGDTLPLRLIFLNAGTLNLDVRVHPPDQELPPIIHRGHKP